MSSLILIALLAWMTSAAAPPFNQTCSLGADASKDRCEGVPCFSDSECLSSFWCHAVFRTGIKSICTKRYGCATSDLTNQGRCDGVNCTSNFQCDSQTCENGVCSAQKKCKDTFISSKNLGCDGYKCTVDADCYSKNCFRGYCTS